MCSYPLTSINRFLIISLRLLFIAICSSSLATRAQTTVLSDNFDSASPGAFGTTYNYASGGNVTSTIVAPGAGGTGQALQLSGNVTNGVSENAGVNSPVYTPTGNTDPTLSDYTLSFDMAITQGANTGVGVTLNIFGTGAADGSSYAVPIGQITVGGGFRHFSVNLGTLPTGYQIPALNPTDSQYSFQLVFLGFNASVTATPETIQLDNLQITVAMNTNTYNASIDPQTTYQTIEGLGGAITFYDGWVPAHPYKLEIYTNAFAGLNVSMLRLADWYRYDAGFHSAGGDGAAAGDIVSNANRVLGHPVQIYMSSWSPPAFLKSNGQTGNGGTLIYTNGGFDYTGFAQYWSDSINAYQSNGVSPTWISIQNEPDWAAGYDSCILDPTEDTVNGTNYASYARALAATYQLLTNRPSPPKLLAPECVHIAYNDLQNYSTYMNSNSFYGVAYHLYGNSANPPNPTPDGYTGDLSSAANIFTGKPHFMTEFGYPDMIQTACLIHDCLTIGQDSGFNYWSLVWPFPGDALVQIENPYASHSTWTNAPPGVTTDSHGWWLTPAYWAMKHFSYFIQPGYRRVSASDNDPNVRSSACLSPDGSRLVVVLINTNATASSRMNFSFGTFNVGTSSVYQTAGTNTYAGTNTFLSLGSLANPQTLPALSLTTVVLDRLLNTGSPTIVMATTGTNLTMSWPVAFAGFTLQSCTNLESANWATVSSPVPQIVGTNYQIALPATNATQFFRLSK